MERRDGKTKPGAGKAENLMTGPKPPPLPRAMPLKKPATWWQRKWTFLTLVVKIKSTGERIDLMKTI
jgi:hypothetical protein